ncbi:hypothetical protein ISF_01318 [Cordyceps fumosorosea ARSEF 2679]|uniref:Uncharacterized protein n=1 Tax=Cordyceps fumosorosea (strain ARSEF 2679) TaxID=1081104 RepID=A0A168D738_CORFA|nr:hypothetical protein ISF_01318 [Cordyceps fumosorosea ARSEF 2679]OAA72245.1 hypothetical protein ISF_01318 [Cordyceps fumosorosea ARSEF 2679]
MERIKQLIKDVVNDSLAVRRIDDPVSENDHKIHDDAHVSTWKTMSRYWENCSPFALNLCGAVMRQGVFVDKLVHLDWLHSPEMQSITKALIEKYRRFLAIMERNPGIMVVPTLDVDLAWHTHTSCGRSPSAPAGYCEGRSLRPKCTDFLGSFRGSGAAKLCPGDSSAHISAHSAVRLTNIIFKTTNAARRIRHLQKREEEFQKARKRGAKEGHQLPSKDEYCSSWGYQYHVHGPWMPPNRYTDGMYCSGDPCSVAAGANCVTNTCGSGVAAGACGLGGGGCVGGGGDAAGGGGGGYAGGGGGGCAGGGD